MVERIRLPIKKDVDEYYEGAMRLCLQVREDSNQSWGTLTFFVVHSTDVRAGIARDDRHPLTAKLNDRKLAWISSRYFSDAAQYRIRALPDKPIVLSFGRKSTWTGSRSWTNMGSNMSQAGRTRHVEISA